MSYSRNIQRLRSRERENLSFGMQDRAAATSFKNQQALAEAKKVASSLSDFSQQLGEWKKRDIAEKTEQGRLAAREQATVNAQKLQALAEELERTKQEDTRYQEIKQEMLKLGGPNVYPDAERLAQLSPWQQVGYAKEKLRAFNDTFGDKLDYAMQNSTDPINIAGVTFTAKQLRDNNIQGLPFKEAAIKVQTAKIRKAANLDRFSPELLALAKTEDSIQKAEDALMGKYRERYNIDASHNTRIKAQKEWANSGKTGDDLYRLFLSTSNTVDKNNAILGNSGGWNSVMSVLQSEGIKAGDPFYAEKIGAQLLPEGLRIKLGAKKGTTFAQQWPGRFTKLKTDIKAGIVAATDAELKYQKAEGKQLEAEFIAAARKAPLSEQEVNEWKRKFGEAGLPIPAGVTNYETLSDRDQREDTDLIKALMASQNGYISNEQLDSFHPLAALEYREKATKMEKAALKEFDAEKKIKAHLDTVWTSMGVKANEKSPAYVEAMANAKADYAVQYNRYIAMGYPPSQASHWALHAKEGEVKDQDGQPIPGSKGVLTEIKENGAGNKYTLIGQSIEKDIKPGTIRVARIASGKREMLDDPDIIHKGTIGGDYGHRQLTTIKNNLEKYGPRGLRMDKGALQYYEGLARGRNPREGGWWGLLDAQLKATGHAGLNPNTRPPGVALASGKDDNGKVLPDPLGLELLRRRLSRAMQFPSGPNNRYIQNTAWDGMNNNGRSVYDRPENLAPHLR